jgi:hypothetical protein
MGHSLRSRRSTSATKPGTSRTATDIEPDEVLDVDAESAEDEDDSLSWFVNLLLAEINAGER